MKKSGLWTLWGVLFILCAALGFIPSPENSVKGMLILASLLFFVPPTLLLYGAHKRHDRHTIALVRNLSAMSLGVTIVVLIVNFASLTLPAWMGDALYGLLIIVSSPMVCAQYWLCSLFLWACLLTASFHLLRRKK